MTINQSILLLSPVAAGKTWTITQGPGGTLSHNGDLYYGWGFALANDPSRTNEGELGLPVHAVADGTVKFVYDLAPDGDAKQPTRGESWGLRGGLGNVITIEHIIDDQKFYSSYLHLQQSSVSVTVGEDVKAGQEIAFIGNTGASGGVIAGHWLGRLFRLREGLAGMHAAETYAAVRQFAFCYGQYQVSMSSTH